MTRPVSYPVAFTLRLTRQDAEALAVTAKREGTSRQEIVRRGVRRECLESNIPVERP